MLIYALPNLILAVFAVAMAGHEFGWQALLSFPYVILLIWLVYSAIIAFALRWYEASEKTDSERILDRLDAVNTLLEAMKTSNEAKGDSSE